MRNLTRAEQAYRQKYPSTAIYTCRDCGKCGGGDDVQPQWPRYTGGIEGIALCVDCIGVLHAKASVARAAQLAAMARCEVEGCVWRGTWRLQGVLLCGRHLRRCKANFHKEMVPHGVLGMMIDVDRVSILRWAGMDRVV